MTKEKEEFYSRRNRAPSRTSKVSIEEVALVCRLARQDAPAQSLNEKSNNNVVRRKNVIRRKNVVPQYDEVGIFQYEEPESEVKEVNKKYLEKFECLLNKNPHSPKNTPSSYPKRAESCPLPDTAINGVDRQKIIEKHGRMSEL